MKSFLFTILCISLLVSNTYFIFSGIDLRIENTEYVRIYTQDQIQMNNMAEALEEYDNKIADYVKHSIDKDFEITEKDIAIKMLSEAVLEMYRLLQEKEEGRIT